MPPQVHATDHARRFTEHPAARLVALLFVASLLQACGDRPEDAESSADAAATADAAADAVTDSTTEGDAGSDAAGGDEDATATDTAGGGAADSAAADGGWPLDTSTADTGGTGGTGGPLPGPVSNQPTGIEITDLGEQSHAKGVKTLGPFEVEVPKDAVSLVITFVGTAGITYGLDTLTSPSGKKLVLAGWVDQQINVGGQMCLSCPLRVAPQLSASAAMVPNTPDVSLEAGKYSFTVLARKRTQTSIFAPPTITHPAGKVRVSAVVKRHDGGLPKAGTLDLNLYFTGSHKLSAKAAPTDKNLQAWLATLKTTYQQAGVAIGKVSYFDIDPKYQVVEGAAGSEAGDFEEIAALTAPSGWGANLVFVREIASPFGPAGAVLGISGGIPGPVGTQGTGRSAVLIATDAKIGGGFGGGPQIDPDVGLTMAHELGHYLGLFHSSENDFGGFQPTINDPIPDTKPKDDKNLMFFDGSKEGTEISAQQGAVMRTNPWVLHPAGGQP